MGLEQMDIEGETKREMQDAKSFLDIFTQGQSLKVIGYGYNYKSKQGYVDVLFEPHDDTAQELRLYSS